MAGKPGSGNKSAKGKTPTQSTALARMQAHQIASSPNSPLNVMLGNMMFWHEASEKLRERMEGLMSDNADMLERGEAPSLDHLKAMQDVMKNFLHAREKSQACAVDAAPYVHPRLQSVTLKPQGKPDEVIIIDAALPTIGPAGQQEDRSYRDDYEENAPVPLRKSVA